MGDVLYFAEFAWGDAEILAEYGMKMFYCVKSHLEGYLFAGQLFRQKDFFTASQFQC